MKKNNICRVILLLTVILFSYTASFPAAARINAAYDTALDELTNPSVNCVQDRLRHPYSNDERLNAKAAAYHYFIKNDIGELWDANPDIMRAVAMTYALNEQPDLDVHSLTNEELSSYLSIYDLYLSDPAPMFERGWYDYDLSFSNTGFSYASEHISGYMFTARIQDQYIALIKVSYLADGSFRVTVQPIPKNYRLLYEHAKSKMTKGDAPFLLTDPELHQAVAFLAPVKHKDMVYIKNYVSSSSKDEILTVDMEVFQHAAINWNHDAISMLLDTNGNVKLGAQLEYNNLESYVRSDLRIAEKEKVLRLSSLDIAGIACIAMTVLILNKRRIRFMEPDDPRTSWRYFLPLPWEQIEKVAASFFKKK